MFKGTNFIVAFFFVFSLSFSFYVSANTVYSADLHSKIIVTQQDSAHEFYQNFVSAPYEIMSSNTLKGMPVLSLNSNDNIGDLLPDQNMSYCDDVSSLSSRHINQINDNFTPNQYSSAIFIVTN